MRIPVAVLLGSLGAATLAAQQPAPQAPADTPPPTFRVEVNYVEVDAVVTDAQGTPVTDLTADDFEVLEDGRRQTVTAFSAVNIPIERRERPLFAAAPIEPDVQVNTLAEGRIYLIVLDDLHTTFTNTPRVRAALRTFVEQNFGANDLAAIVFTSGAVEGQEFTSSPRLLLAAVERFAGRNLRSEALEAADALRNRLPEEFRSTPRGGGSQNPSVDPKLAVPADPLEAERAYRARSALTSIQRLAEFMEGVRGRRKSMLLVSEGISYDIFDVFANTSSNLIVQLARDAAAAATRSNVAIYAIDPRGLSALDEGILAATVPSDVTPTQFSVAGALMDSMRTAQQSLQVLAAETGGFAAINRNDFAGAFERIVRENSVYYVLGYHPTNDRRDGRFRRIEVRVTRPGLQVRSRRGYVASRGRSPEAPRAGSPLAVAAATALNSPIPIGGIPLSFFAAPFKGTAPNATVALTLELRADDFKFAERNGLLIDRVEIAFSAIDAKGNVRPGDRHTVSLDLRPETAALTRQRGLRVLSEMALPPGRYQIRASAAAEGNGRTGSVLYDLDIPDFYGAPLSMSGIVVTSGAALGTPTMRPKDPLGSMLPGPPAATREFVRADIIALFAEVYEHAPGAPVHTLELTTTMRDTAGRVVFQHTEERSSTDLQGGSGGYGYTVQIPLADIVPGIYVIRVEARSRAAGDTPAVGRDVVVEVR